MGYALIGLAAGTGQGIEAMLLYMAIYVTMNLGVFAFILSMTRDGQAVSDISDLNGYAKREPGKALAMLALMFSLAGVPPFLGFFGKLAVMWAAVEAGLVWLAVLGVIASVIGAFYYIRIVYYMYFGEDVDALDGKPAPVLWFFAVATGAIVAVAWVPGVNRFGVDPAAAKAAIALVN